MAVTVSGMKQKAMQMPKRALVMGTWYRRAVGVAPVFDVIENMVKRWNGNVNDCEAPICDKTKDN